MLIALVNGGAIVDYRTKDGSTAVHKSVAKNNSEALRTLLDLGASPNYKDSKGLTPLYLTVSQATDVLLTEMLLHDRALVGAQVNLSKKRRPKAAVSHKRLVFRTCKVGRRCTRLAAMGWWPIWNSCCFTWRT